MFKNYKEIKSDNFQFQLIWYCLFINHANIELEFLNLNIWTCARRSYKKIF